MKMKVTYKDYTRGLKTRTFEWSSWDSIMNLAYGAGINIMDIIKIEIVPEEEF